MRKDGFFDPIKHPKWKTLVHMHKSMKLLISQSKVVEYKQQRNIALHLLVKPQAQIDRKLVLHKLLTGSQVFSKNSQIEKLQTCFEKYADAQLPDPRQSFIIEDGTAVFHYLREIPQTFGEISRKVLRSALHLLPVIFGTDMYKENSVQGVERNR
ncbi:Hypothetical predicted protein [Octopus vulgaris]|uniref:Uncharacterized protein n=1 Tax=Octopus vulgaris TaxID=6645 RepID=A0AA36EWN7_OCTVU|nr:Hypothetical predicted protein [Octopus vulgaris]